MSSIRHNKSLRTLLSSLVGKGMPERIRSIGFACLGLTAAAGLALVAVFAQMGFPLLAPAPLPSVPSGHDSVAKAVQLGGGPSAVAVAIAPARDAATAPAAAGARFDSGSGTSRGGSSGLDTSGVPVAGSPSGAGSDTSDPAPSPAPEASPAPTPTPSPAPSSEPASAPVELPVTSPGVGDKPSTAKPVTSKPNEPEEEPTDAKPAKPVEDKPGTPSKDEEPPKSDSEPDATPPVPSYDPDPVPAPTNKDSDRDHWDRDWDGGQDKKYR